MNLSKWVGIVLIVLGGIALTYEGITYRSREKVLDLGAVQVTAVKTRTLPIPPLVAILAVGAGCFLLFFVSSRK